jgi:hypothetical protein
LCLIVVAGLTSSGCGDFMTDAATRLANDVVREAKELRKSGDTERTFVHHPKASPESCSRPYRIKFQESLHHPASGGSLLVRCGVDPTFKESDHHFSTTYHLNAVRVPVELVVEKPAGAELKVTLRKNGEAIELVGLE